MTNYTKGRNLEYRAIRKLEEDGWKTMRSAGSKSLWDIFAYNYSKMKVIQVKRNKPTKKEIKSLQKVLMSYFLKRELWIFEKGKKEPKIIIL